VLLTLGDLKAMNHCGAARTIRCLDIAPLAFAVRRVFQYTSKHPAIEVALGGYVYANFANNDKHRYETVAVNPTSADRTVWCWSQQADKNTCVVGILND
jgi:hypothetical protein